MQDELETIESLKKLPLVSRDYTKQIDRFLAPYQLNSSLYYYLLKLHAYGDMPQEELVRLTSLNPSNVTRAVKKIQELDYVTKKTNPDDGRGYVLTLTETGTSLYPVIKECLQKANAAFLSPLTDTEQQQLIALINRLGA